MEIPWVNLQIVVLLWHSLTYFFNDFTDSQKSVTVLRNFFESLFQFFLKMVINLGYMSKNDIYTHNICTVHKKYTIRTTIKKSKLSPLDHSRDNSPPANRYMLEDRKGDFRHDTRNAARMTFLSSQWLCLYLILTTVSCIYLPQK